MSGRAHMFGDAIDTDRLAPGHAMKLAPEAMAHFCLETLDAGFAARVRPGDVIVAGANFGCGSAREQAALALKTLGIAAVLARSFARIFYRNAINLGLPAFVLPPEVAIADGATLSLDVATGELVDESAGAHHRLAPLSPHLAAIVSDGGLIAHLKRRFDAEKTR